MNSEGTDFSPDDDIRLPEAMQCDAMVLPYFSPDDDTNYDADDEDENEPERVIKFQDSLEKLEDYFYRLFPHQMMEFYDPDEFPRVIISLDSDEENTESEPEEFEVYLSMAAAEE